MHIYIKKVYICNMIQLKLEQRAKILNLSKEYYKRCKDRNKYDDIIDKTTKMVIEQIISLIKK